MIFRQVINEDLGSASYFIADEGEAIVVDPGLEIGAYLSLAQTARARIAHVLETHVHADHLSGRARLAAETGAAIRMPAPVAADAGAESLDDADEVRAGAIVLTALATPGHRPEHFSYAVTDPARSSSVALLLSGDSLLVGGVARPDLAASTVAGAHALYRSLRRIAGLGDQVELFPAHVGGSLCASRANLDARASSTIGYEQLSNPLLALDSEEEFMAELTADPPPPPPRMQQLVARNRGRLHDLPPMPGTVLPDEAVRMLSEGALLIDGRDPDHFDREHLRGSINLPAISRQLGTRAGWAIAPGSTAVLGASSRAEADSMTRRLRAAGVFEIAGVVNQVPALWAQPGIERDSSATLEPDRAEAGAQGGEVFLVDVRDSHEWRRSHVAGSVNVPLAQIGEVSQNGLLPRDRPLAVVCGLGPRSALAASLLRRAGFEQVVRVRGEIGELDPAGLELGRT